MTIDRTIQAPIAAAPAVDLSRTLWRKQVLKAGTINYAGRKLTFDRDYLTDLAASFKAGAYDQVPFVLATADNAHNLLPERVRGEVKALEVTADGLDALIELSDEGAAIVKDNPRLGVSCRIAEGLEQADGRSFSRAVNHVLGTLDPRITGMRPWEAVELSTPGEAVVDLTSATYEEATVPELTEDEVTQLRALLSANPAAGQPPAADPAPGEPDDAAIEAAVAALLADPDPDPEPAGASLSADPGPSAIDLARAETAEAKQMAVQMRRELWDAKLASEAEVLLSKGYAPAVVDLCRPLLYGNGVTVDDPSVVDLSNSGGSPLNVADQVRKLLEAVGPQIDLSAEHGYAVPATRRTAPQQADELLDLWEKQHPFKGGK